MPLGIDRSPLVRPEGSPPVAFRLEPPRGLRYLDQIPDASRILALIAAAGSLALLIGAMIFEHGFGMAPCMLCLWQRWPHVVAVALGALVLTWKKRLVLFAGGAAAGTSAGIAFYHTGVERGWFAGPQTCSGGLDVTALSPAELLDRIMAAPVVRCADVPWEMLGLSMASWNGILSVGLAGLWLWSTLQAPNAHGHAD